MSEPSSGRFSFNPIDPVVLTATRSVQEGYKEFVCIKCIKGLDHVSSVVQIVAIADCKNSLTKRTTINWTNYKVKFNSNDQYVELFSSYEDIYDH